MIEEERHEDVETWSQVFHEEGFDVKARIIERRLKEAQIIGETVRSDLRHVVNLCKYAESDVRRLCEDLIQVYPQADENGLIEIDGQIYGTSESLALPLDISADLIELRIQKSRLRPIQGKTRNGDIVDFYLFVGVQKACERLIQNLPLADENGLIEKDGETYGTVKSLVKKLGLPRSIIKSKIQQSPLATIRGKEKSGHIVDFYPLSELKNRCEDSLNLPTADENGLIVIDGETYGSMLGLNILFGVDSSSIRGRIEKRSPKSIRGKTVNGRLYNYYLVSEIEKTQNPIDKCKESND